MQDIVTIGEIERKRPDEWVLVEVTRDHKEHRRVRGRLLAHSPDRSDLDEPHGQFRAAHPDARLFEFFTGDVVADEGVVIIL